MSLRIEVRATGLKSARQRAGITQRELARRVDVTQNYIPAIEANTRQAGPELRQPLLDAVGAEFWEVFEIVLHDQMSGRETPLMPATRRGSAGRRRHRRVGGSDRTRPADHVGA